MSRRLAGIAVWLCLGTLGCGGSEEPASGRDSGAGQERATASADARPRASRTPRQRYSAPPSIAHRRELRRLRRQRSLLDAHDRRHPEVVELDARIEAFREAADRDLPDSPVVTQWVDQRVALAKLRARGFVEPNPGILAARARVSIAEQAFAGEGTESAYPAIEVELRMRASGVVLRRGGTKDHPAVRCVHAQLAELASLAPPSRRRPSVEELHVRLRLERVELKALRGYTDENAVVVTAGRKIRACEAALDSRLSDEVVERTLRLELQRIELVGARGLTAEHPKVARLDALLATVPERYSR